MLKYMEWNDPVQASEKFTHAQVYKIPLTKEVK